MIYFSVHLYTDTKAHFYLFIYSYKLYIHIYTDLDIGAKLFSHGKILRIWINRFTKSSSQIATFYNKNKLIQTNMNCCDSNNGIKINWTVSIKTCSLSFKSIAIMKMGDNGWPHHWQSLETFTFFTVTRPSLLGIYHADTFCSSFAFCSVSCHTRRRSNCNNSYTDVSKYR